MQKLNSDAAKAIEKSTLQADIILYRGVDRSAASATLGLDVDKLANGEIDLSHIIGKTYQDKGFMSCGSAAGAGFTDDVQYRFYAPAGTKALYAEPFSAFGGGYTSGISGKSDWDGVSKQSYFGGEFETILQRGTKVQITGVEKSTDGQIIVDAQVVGCEY